MAEISLRQYVQQIDDIIEDSEQLEEAIAHCRHILKSFPKHIDTYRLLGKAYLESKRYGDAADIFQRVLSAIPDDFVSHVGMAIIREDEGNLDAAIWHMERSSESKPGNAAIEQELKRLIGKRDGLEPQRVRPTRGALARMYSHGELFSYATTELRKALDEDPDRPDLQVLLANTFWRTDQRLDAAKLCSLILEKLPHCRDANRITAALLQESGKTEEAKSNIRRLISLDPYFAYLKNPMDDPLSVETSSILIERITWSGGQESTSPGDAQPDWAASLGVDFTGDEAPAEIDEDMPEWLKSEGSPNTEEQDAEPDDQPTIHPFEGASPPQGEDIPQWMQEAGWGGDGEPDAVDQNVPSDPDDPDDDPEDLAAAEYPDWLTDITSTDQEQTATPLADELDDFPSDLGEQGFEKSADFDFDEQTEDSIGIDDNAPEDNDGGNDNHENDNGSEPDMTIPEDDMPENFFNENQEEKPKDESSPEPVDQGSIIDAEMAKGGTQELPPWLEPAAPGATDTIVTWLGDKSGDGSPAPSEDIPTWMRGTGPLVEPSLSEVPEENIQPEMTEPSPVEQEPSIDLFAEEAATSNATEATDTAVDAEPARLENIGEQEDSKDVQQDSEAAPDWIESIPLEDDQFLGSEQEPEQAPDWLSTADISESESEVSNDQEETPPEWLNAVLGKDDEDEVQDTPESDEQPDWLQGIRDNLDGEEQAVLESPDWLTDSIEEQVSESQAEEVQPEWLKTLSDSTMDENQETAAPEDSAPEWLTEEIESSEPEVAGTEAMPSAPVEDVPEELPLRDAVEAIVEEPIEESSTSDDPESVLRTIEGPKTEEIAPDWLQDLAVDELSDEVDDQEVVETTADPDWLQQIEADEIASTSETPDVAHDPILERADDQEDDEAWEPEFVDTDTQESESSVQRDAEKEIENRLDWLQESAQEVTPEPDLSIQQEEEIYSTEEISEEADVVEDALDKPLAEEEVYGFLEGLASKHEVELEEIPIFSEEAEAEEQASTAEAEVKSEDAQTEPPDELPEEYEAGLEWLEELATEDEYEEVIAPDFQSETEESVDSEVPEWLEEVAERSEEDELESVRLGSEASSEDPSILDTIIGKKSDLIQMMDKPKEEAPSETDLADVEHSTRLEDPEVVDLSVEGISETLPEASDLEMDEIKEPVPEIQEVEQPEMSAVDIEEPQPQAEAPVDADAAGELDETTSVGQLSIARAALQDGNLERALEFYTRLIDQKKEVESVISDLQTAVDNTPMSPTLWQTLGDAFMQDGKVTEAIDAYRKGMEAV